MVGGKIDQVVSDALAQRFSRALLLQPAYSGLSSSASWLAIFGHAQKRLTLVLPSCTLSSPVPRNFRNAFANHGIYIYIQCLESYRKNHIGPSQAVFEIDFLSHVGLASCFQDQIRTPVRKHPIFGKTKDQIPKDPAIRRSGG